MIVIMLPGAEGNADTVGRSSAPINRSHPEHAHLISGNPGLQVSIIRILIHVSKDLENLVFPTSVSLSVLPSRP